MQLWLCFNDKYICEVTAKVRTRVPEGKMVEVQSATSCGFVEHVDLLSITMHGHHQFLNYQSVLL